MRYNIIFHYFFASVNRVGTYMIPMLPYSCLVKPANAKNPPGRCFRTGFTVVKMGLYLLPLCNRGLSGCEACDRYTER